MKKLLAMLVATFALGLTVGCGGSSSTPAVAPKPPASGASSKDDMKKEEPKKEEPKKEEPKKEEPKKEEPKKEEKK